MLQSVKIQSRQSEIRQRMAALNLDTDAGMKESETLQTEYKRNEIEYRQALILESAERDKLEREKRANEPAPKDSFEKRAADMSVAKVFEADHLDGLEAEIQQEMLKRGNGARNGGRMIPWEALEVRADAATTTSTTDGLTPRPQQQTLHRLFEMSAAGRFGARMSTVSGSPRYPTLTAGATVGWVAEGSGKDAEAITVSTVEPAIHTATARYLFSRQSVREGGMVESVLRRDLMGVMMEATDKAFFQGAGGNGSEPAGLEATITAATTDKDKELIGYGDIVGEMIRLHVAAKTSGIAAGRVILRPEAAKPLFTNIGGENARGMTDYQYLRDMGIQIITSPQVDTVYVDTQISVSEGYSMVPGFADIVTWGGVEILHDPFSHSKTAQIALTIFCYMDTVFRRTGTHYGRFGKVKSV